MNTLLLVPVLVFTAASCFAIEVHEPKPETMNSVEIHSIDDEIATLGAVDFVIDLGGARDDLFELTARRKNLTLKDGRPIDVFGYNKEIGVIIGAASPVAYISVTGSENGNILALFHNNKNEVVAPNRNDIRVFDLNYEPLKFSYTPALPPQNLTMNVSLLIDVSGSMANALDDVTNATRDFMRRLPDFTRCSVLTFGTTVERLTDPDLSKLKPCPDSLSVLDGGLKLNGATALHLAIQEGLQAGEGNKNTLPNLVIALTDGFDTQNPEITVKDLTALKQKTNSKILMFWAGSYDPNYLAGLADIETVSTQNILTDLDGFLRTIGVSISGLQTLTLQ